MLIDEAEITIKAGHGGAGKVSFGKAWKSGPDGGNGGCGGDIYAVCVNDITLLNQFSAELSFSAQSGLPGEQGRKTGKDGKDLELMLPIGTTILELETKRDNGLTTHGETIELTVVGQKELLAKGGLGGRGNWEFRSPKNTTPMQSQVGLPGEERKLKLELKLIADFGLIGLPNAGKSSLLNELTSAKAKIGAYAFTTLSPNLGVMDGKVIADVPGLIEGAHEGRGLGINFLKHIEKVGTLLHCISGETQDIEKDYKTIRDELGKYSQKLLTKKEILIITKTDLLEKDDLKKLIQKAKKLNKNIISVSIFDFDSISSLPAFLFSS